VVVKRAGAHFQIIGLNHHAALSGPKSVQGENHILKIHTLSSTVRITGQMAEKVYNCPGFAGRNPNPLTVLRTIIGGL
jgi:hypothetical protein